MKNELWKYKIKVMCLNNSNDKIESVLERYYFETEKHLGSRKRTSYIFNFQCCHLPENYDTIDI